MSRMTISLDADLERELRETAAHSGTTVDAIIAQALRQWGVNRKGDVDAVLAQARSHGPSLGDDELLQLAVAEVRDHRHNHGAR